MPLSLLCGFDYITLSGCDQLCEEPLTATPYGSPCGCVFPMKVKLLLSVAPYAVFPVMNELEIEVATGIYLQQSQVKIMGATADTQNQGRTLVEVNLVPLGEKFDNTTAVLTYDRLLHKRVSLNSTLFGTYEVVSISYPGTYFLKKHLRSYYFVVMSWLQYETHIIRNSFFTTIW